MEEETKQCPFCGESIKVQAKKCKHCGKWLNESDKQQNITSLTKACPYCGEEIPYAARICPNCKENLYKSNDKVIIIVLSAILGIILLTGLISLICHSVGGKAPNCEAKETKEQLIGIFKENSSCYKSINQSTIDSIVVKTPLAESYDKDIDKYTCTANIYMKSTTGGFRFDSDYSYFNKKHYTSYKSDRINYSSQISEGRPVVMSSTSYGWDGFEE